MLGSTERETDRRTADLDASSVRPYGPSSAPAAAGMKRVPAMIMILFPPFHARRKLQLRLKRDKNHSALTRVPISANHVIAAALLLLLPSMVLFTRERESWSETEWRLYREKRQSASTSVSQRRTTAAGSSDESVSYFTGPSLLLGRGVQT